MTTDKLVTLSNRLKEVKEKFEALQECGIDKDILVSYVKDKTRLSKGDVLKMLKAQQEFYDKLIKKAIIDGLEDKR